MLQCHSNEDPSSSFCYEKDLNYSLQSGQKSWKKSHFLKNARVGSYVCPANVSCLFTYFLGISAACLLNYSTDRLEIKIIFFFKIFTHSAFTWGSKAYSAKIQHFFLISLICFGLRPLAKWSLLQFSFFVLHAHKLICLQAIIHTQCLKIIKNVSSQFS